MIPPAIERNVRSISELTPNQQEVDREARLRWNKTAEELAPEFLSSYSSDAWTQRVADSPLGSIVESLPAADPTRTLAFSLNVTESAVNEVLADEENPYRLVFLAARLAEYGMYSYPDPEQPATGTRNHMAASKALGYFFTPPEVAMSLAVSSLGDRDAVEAALDPAAGLGSLLGAVALAASHIGCDVGHLRGVELDGFTARLCDSLLIALRSRIGGRWTHSITQEDALVRLSAEIEGSITGYDAIVLNPPYGRVKFLRSALTNAETIVQTTTISLDEHEARHRSDARDKAARLKTLSEQLGLGAGEQNLQRLFIALCHARLSDGGRMAVISPSSWMGDRDGTGLRQRLVGSRSIESISVYPEDSGLFATVNQVTAVSVITPPSARDRLAMKIERARNGNGAYEISYEELQSLDRHRLRIPKLDARRSDIFRHLQSLPRIGDLSEVRNARGELDLTANKQFILEEGTHRLIRGDHVERFVLRPAEYSKQPSFVDKEGFVGTAASASKADDLTKRRLASRQVSYLNKARRLSFAPVPPGSVLGNSCNYLVSTEQAGPHSDALLDGLLCLLNSAAIEWFFRVFNSNNHVANYEIDELPVVASEGEWEVLANSARHLEWLYSTSDLDSKTPQRCEDLSDAIVCHLLGLGEEDARTVIGDIEPHRAERVASMVAWISSHRIPDGVLDSRGWYQHTAPSLSAHDLEVTRNIPQGGNWQNIPEDIPSKRLEQIREMTIERGGAVRTSYYGRLRPDQPAYTIATYYNRPGNGTNIVPWSDRTLTSREAARLQSFPDWFFFAPKEGPNRKHIGNAVPPLLAYAVAGKLGEHTESKVAVDLFCGAGGLSLGLELAGWQVAAAIDHDQRALDTYGLNRPTEQVISGDIGRTLTICADLSVEARRAAVVEAIREKCGSLSIGAIVGGPPCQGYSTAGWRLRDDERNDLAVVFMEIIDELQPEMVLLENVEGLLNYRKGAVVSELLATMRELGYETGESPWVLAAEQYGVPQMRRRVFLVGHRRDVISQPAPLFERCRGRREFKQGATLFGSSLPYPTTVVEALGDLPRLGETTHASLGERQIRHHYESWLKDRLSTDEMLRLMVGENDR